MRINIRRTIRRKEKKTESHNDRITSFVCTNSTNFLLLSTHSSGTSSLNFAICHSFGLDCNHYFMSAEEKYMEKPPKEQQNEWMKWKENEKYVCEERDRHNVWTAGKPPQCERFSRYFDDTELSLLSPSLFFCPSFSLLSVSLLLSIIPPAGMWKFRKLEISTTKKATEE